MPTRATIPIRTLGSPHYGVRIAVLLGAALAVAPAPVLAEMQVSGTANAVRIDAQDAPLEEVLAALNRAFGVHYQLSVNLDKRLSGTYEGSLPQVLRGILNGYNFLLYTDNGVTAVTVAGTANAPAKSPGRPASSSAQVVGQPSPAAPSAQAPIASSGVPVASSGVEEVPGKGPLSILASVAGQSGAPVREAPRRSTVAPALRPVPQSRPFTAALEPRPSTAAPQLMPSTAALQLRPSTAALQLRPFTSALEPMLPSTAASQSRPSTAAPHPRPSKAASQARPSRAASQPSPSRGLPP
jgi:hypothetical protein